MFSKLFFVIFAISTFYSTFAFSNVSTIPCLSELTEYGPLLKTGNISPKEQDYFFQCVYSFLDLIVKGHLVVPPEGRDYFKREEIHALFKRFNIAEKKSEELTDSLFIIKHFFVGGKKDQLSSEHLEVIYKHVYDYRDFYYTIHSKLGVINRIFDLAKKQTVTEEALESAVEKIHQGITNLTRKYQKSGFAYKIKDFSHLMAELKRFQKGDSSWNQYAYFMEAWSQGLFAPKASIQKGGWIVYNHAFHSLMKMFFYYNRYVAGQSITRPSVVFRTLQSLGFLMDSVSMVSYNKLKDGFPVKNMDKMLSAVFILAKDSENSKFFGAIDEESTQPTSLFTRVILCFSLKPRKGEKCSHSIVRNEGESPYVEYRFQDGVFKYHKNRQEWLPNSNAFNISEGHFADIKKWLSSFQEVYKNRSASKIRESLEKNKVDHWGSSSFQERPNDSRIIFYPYTDLERNNNWAFRLLNYRFLSQFLLSSYESHPIKGFNQETWVRIVDEIFPALLSFQSSGYDLSLRKSFKGLFEYADSFLNSSNYDGFLNDRELVDLIVHVLQASYNSEKAFDKLKEVCVEGLSSSCIAQEIFSQEDVMKSFPRLNVYLQNYDDVKYVEKTKELLDSQSPISYPDQLIDFFLLLQMVEIQLHQLDKNKNSKVESYEIFPLVQTFSEKIVQPVIPYLKNKIQAQSFLMYSFKTSHIPFIQQGDQSYLSSNFFYWHLNRRNEEFSLYQGDVYSTVVSFYQLYSQQL